MRKKEKRSCWKCVSIHCEQKRRPDCLPDRLSVSTKWLCHFVEFAFFTVSGADGREKWKEWFRLWPKPPRPTGIAGRYESSQRGIMPLRHLLIWFVDSLRRPDCLHDRFLCRKPGTMQGFFSEAKEKLPLPQGSIRRCGRAKLKLYQSRGGDGRFQLLQKSFKRYCLISPTNLV